MCGIVTIVKNKYSKQNIDKNLTSEEVLKKMLKAIKHRGPDHTGQKTENEEYSYGMTRLSIIDLSSGEQPITTIHSGNEYTIVFNGEIYNYKDLKKELLADNFKFKTNSDTEVILNLFIKYKENPKIFLNKLRGMFAFSIFNKTEDKIFVARDFFGIKPLYYLKRDLENIETKNKKNKRVILAFGSEIKSLLLHPEYSKNSEILSQDKINFSAVKNYLSYQYNPLEETFFKNIFKLSPGNYMEISQKTGEFEIKNYFDFNFLSEKKLQENAGYKDLESVENATFDLIKESVKYHLEADVPVGAFLSGGVDSFITTAMIRYINPKAQIHTFTIGGEEKNEFEGAKMASNFLKTNHSEIKLSREKYFKNLPKMIWHFDEPVADPAGFALYFLSEKARKKVKVVLAGEGADELFGGYGLYKVPIDLSPVSKLPTFIKSILSLTQKLPFNFKGKNYIKRALTPIEDRYIGNAHIFNKKEIEKIWKKDIEKNKTLESLREFNIKKLYKKASHLSDSAKMQYIDIKTWLIGDILQKGDKMSMAQSLEVRTPFLDRVVSEFAKKIPDNLKYKYATKDGEKNIKGQDTKYLLRKVAQRLSKEIKLEEKEEYLRKELADRKRVGFVMPLTEWMQKEISDNNSEKKENWKEQILTSLEKGFFSTFLEKKEIEKLIENFKNLKNIPKNINLEREYTRKLFTLFVLDTWYKEFFDKK